MPKFSLNPFTDLIDKKFNFTVEINQNDQAFFISYLITGDLTAINWGSLSPMKKRIIKLWEKTCFELFIKNERNEYIEFNFSPAFEWNCFYFKKPGDPLLEWEKMLRPNTDILLSLDKFFLFAEIKKEYLPEGFMTQNMSMGITSILKLQNNETTYWALGHNDLKPNFHHFESFKYKF